MFLSIQMEGGKQKVTSWNALCMRLTSLDMNFGYYICSSIFVLASFSIIP